MTRLTDSPRPRRPLTELLLAELANREGRWAAVSRIAVGCSLTVALAMVFEIPQPTYMAYIVFAVSKDEKNSTVTAAAGALVSVTVAVLITLGLSLIDTAEPALRLPLMALVTFAGMFSVRTFALGPISYLAGFVVVLLQSVVDDVPTPEALTRASLWIWVVVAVPIVVTVVVNLLYGQSAELLLDRAVRKVLRELQRSLVAGDFRHALARWREQLAPVLEIERHATTSAHGKAGTAAPRILALLEGLVILEAAPADLAEADRQNLGRIVGTCLGARDAGPLEQTPVVLAFKGALGPFRVAGTPPDAAVGAVPPATKRLFVPDAFHNPAYWQFSLKTTFAVMASYAIYTLLDWPGLRTCIVTCFFVALSSLGETVHKLVLRLAGATLGGVIAGLCIVFVLPHLTDVGQLCLLIGSVAAAAAWVATSSELLAYAGMQIAFAFFLGILQGYAPANDLTVLRDRLVGILLGNVMITLVFSAFWPESARSGLRAALIQVLKGVAAVLRQPGDRAARLDTTLSLVRAHHFSSLSAFELHLLPPESSDHRLPAVSCLERLAGAAFVLTSEAVLPRAAAGAGAPYSVWADAAAQSLADGRPIAPGAALSTTTSPIIRRAADQLESEIRYVVSSAY